MISTSGSEYHNETSSLDSCSHYAKPSLKRDGKRFNHVSFYVDLILACTSVSVICFLAMLLTCAYKIYKGDSPPPFAILPVAIGLTTTIFSVYCLSKSRSILLEKEETQNKETVAPTDNAKKDPVQIGKTGEFNFAKELDHFKRTIPLTQSFHNILIPVGDGFTQIDHIIVSPKGVFVIEQKHFSGWIFGSQFDKEWTQVLNGKKFPFQNPLRQNTLHTKAITEFLKIPERHVLSTVVFSGGAQFKKHMPRNVMRAEKFAAYFRNQPDIMDVTHVGKILYSIRTRVHQTNKHEEEIHLQGVLAKS